MPNFIQVKKWIQEAAELMGAKISGRKAKHYAGEYLLTLDAQLSYNSLTYSDTTGEEACKRWFMEQAVTV